MQLRGEPIKIIPINYLFDKFIRSSSFLIKKFDKNLIAYRLLSSICYNSKLVYCRYNRVDELGTNNL